MSAGPRRASYPASVQPLRARHRGDLLVLGYAAVAQVEVHVWYPTLSVLPRLLLLAGVLSLLARSRFPRLAPVACALGGAATSAWLGEQHTGTAIVTAAIAAALLGRQGSRGVAALGAVVAIVVSTVAANLSQRSDLLTAPLLVLVVAGVSSELFRASRQVDEVRLQIAAVEASSRAEQSAMLGGERRRMARELHDVVSHHLTVAALQASGARVQLESGANPSRALEALRAAEQAGRQALTELRPLLDVVGGEGGLVPTPGLADVPALVAQVREGGVRVELTGTQCGFGALPPGHGLIAYRVLQEALTNAVRHGQHRVDVHVDVHPERVEIEVHNEMAAGRPTAPGGHGLVGMRERLALYGGRLDAGRRGARWVVHAELPLPMPQAVDV